MEAITAEIAFMATVGGQGVRHSDGPGAPDVSGGRLHHGSGARDRSGHRRSCRNGDAAAVHLQHGPLHGVRAAARSWLDHRDRRPDPGGAVRRAGRRRLGRDRARRLPDGQEGRGRARAQRRLHVVADGRRVRRLPDGDLDPDPAPGDAVPRLARAARVLGARHLDGGGALRQRAAARPDRRLHRHHDRDDRHRSAIGHAALDLRQPLSVGRLAADAAAARRLRAARAVRLADRTHRHRGRHQRRPTSTRASGRA